MNWAGKLFETKRKKDSIDLSVYSKDSEFMLVNDLVLAVLDKNKEIENGKEIEYATLAGFKDDLIEAKQARAFRELVAKAEELKK